MTEVSARAAALHEGPVVDGHADSFGDIPSGELRDYLAPSTRGHLDLERQQAAGIDLSLQAVFTPGEHRGDAALAYCADFVARILATLRRSRGALTLVRELAQLTRSPAIMLHLEGVTPLDGRLERVEAFDAWGFRSVGLTHDFASEAAGGCRCADDDDTLTDFGRALVAEIEPRGWLLDVAHLGARSLAELLEVWPAPLVSTHTGMAALAPTPRNLTDDQVRALAATGGLVAIDFVPEHLLPSPAEGGPPPSTVDDVFRHIDHAAALVGDAHVAIGSDFDGYSSPLGGMDDARDYPRLTERMLAAGYADDAVARILGGNMLRVLRARLARREEPR